MIVGMGYRTAGVIKETYGNLCHVIEDSDRNMRYFLITNEKSKTQIIILAGAVNELVLQKKNVDVFSEFGFDLAVDIIDNSLVKFLKKDFNLFIYGHSLGAALAVIFAVHLQSEGHRISKVITFGQPKIVREKDLMFYQSLPLLQVVDASDPVPANVFQGYCHTGEVVVLFPGPHYSYLTEHKDDPNIPKSFDSNHIESYKRNLKNKQKQAIYVPYAERSKVIN
jgi:predicted lipase